MATPYVRRKRTRALALEAGPLPFLDLALPCPRNRVAVAAPVLPCKLDAHAHLPVPTRLAATKLRSSLPPKTPPLSTTAGAVKVEEPEDPPHQSP